jgi:competence protein ComEA
MRKIIFLMGISATFLFSAINLQTASKKELMCIKGIGEKKAQAIIEYRKKNKIKSVDELLNIKGFGKGLIENIKKEVKTQKCGGKKDTSKKNKPKKETKKQPNSKAKGNNSKKDTTKKTAIKSKDTNKAKK